MHGFTVLQALRQQSRLWRTSRGLDAKSRGLTLKVVVLMPKVVFWVTDEEKVVFLTTDEEKDVFLTTDEEKVVFLTTDEEKSRVFDDG